MIALGTAFKAALRSPLLPFWLVIALLPFGRSAELGTFLCLLGVIFLFMREPHALQQHAGARLLLWLLARLCGRGADLAPSTRSCRARAGARCRHCCATCRWACTRALRSVASAAAGAVYRRGRGAGLWCVDAWLQAFTGWSLGGHAEAERISGIFGADNLKLGPTLAVLSPFALWAARAAGALRACCWPSCSCWGRCCLPALVPAWLCYALVGVGFAWRDAGTPWRFAGLCAGGLLVLSLAGMLPGIPRHASMSAWSAPCWRCRGPISRWIPPSAAGSTSGTPASGCSSAPGQWRGGAWLPLCLPELCAGE